MLLHRITLPFINAIFITLILLYLMFLLIDIEAVELPAVKSLGPISWVNAPEEEPVKTIVTKPVKPTTPDQAPVLDKFEPEFKTSINQDLALTTDYKPPARQGLPKIENQQLMRIFGQPGQYPNRAIQRGIEGYVVVGFSVDQAGMVFDAYIVESEPQGIFERSALKAIKKFKYRPKLVNGKAVATAGQQYLFSYKLDQQ